MLSSALKTDSQSLGDDEYPSHSSSNNEKLILDSQAFIDVFEPNGNIGNFDSFAVTSSVIDSEGSTYIIGNLKLDKISFGNLPTVDVNNAIGRTSTSGSPVIAKVSSNGAWDWVYYPVPRDAIICGGDKNEITIDETHGSFNSIDLSADESKIAIVGHFTGCYQFTSSITVYNSHMNTQEGMVVQLNARTGSVLWASEIDIEDTDPDGEIILNAVSYSGEASSTEQIYVGGHISSATVGSAASGIGAVVGDFSGDAYFLALDAASGNFNYHVDSCTKNDPSSSSDNCNNAGKESIRTIDVYDGKIVLGMMTRTPSNNITLFGSPESLATNSMIEVATGWILDENTFANYISVPLEFGLDSTKDHRISDSIVISGQLRFLINSLGNGDIGVSIFNLDKGTNLFYKTNLIGTAADMIPSGFIHGEGIGSYFAMVWKGSPISIDIIDENSQALGIANIVSGYNYLDINNHGTLLPMPNSFADNVSLNIANTGTYTSIIGANLQYSGWIVEEFAHDADMDGIPDNFDYNSAVPNDQDADGDSILDNVDNCPSTWNFDQLNFDNDDHGDACDNDLDGDQILNNIPVDHQGADECPYQDSSMNDADGDGCLDIPDSDEDGVLDSYDICPGDDTIDTDNDGQPDYCDSYPFDWDNDGANDTVDICQGYSDYDDSDGDGIPYGCDEYPEDTDNDGVINSLDNCITTFNPDQKDSGGEPNGDACDYDIDGDGVNNSIPVDINATDNFDGCPYSYSSANNDSDRDGCDDEPVIEQCDVCDNDDDAVKGEEKTNDTIIDPSDIPTAAAIGGAGILGGGFIALIAGRMRGALRYIGVDDGLELLKHLPRRKKKDGGSDHYFKKGLIRQQEMTNSADKNLDDYIEDDI